VRGAIRLARGLHTVAVACLAALVASQPLGPAGPAASAVLWAGAAVVALLLLWEHRLVRADDLSRVDAAFFTMNGLISMSFLAAVLLARVLSGRGA
jgi:4-hydroxybenzoate polyprenyltransferase